VLSHEVRVLSHEVRVLSHELRVLSHEVRICVLTCDRECVLQILGIVVFAIGIWAIVEDQNYSFVTGNAIASGAAILIVSGIITMIICFFGIIGAIFKLRPILVLVRQ